MSAFRSDRRKPTAVKLNMKILLLMLLLGFAAAVVMVLVARLNTIAGQLGDLKGQLKKNDEKLRVEMDVTDAAYHDHNRKDV